MTLSTKINYDLKKVRLIGKLSLLLFQSHFRPISSTNLDIGLLVSYLGMI